MDKLAKTSQEDSIFDLRPPDTSGLPEALRADVEAAFEHQSKNIADSTRLAYKRAWKRFLAWARSNGLPALPATPDTVLTYAAHLARKKGEQEGSKFATVRVAVAAIGAAHREAGIDPNPIRSERVRSQLRGIARDKGTRQDSKRALTDADVRRMVRLCPAGVIGLRDRALILLWFICASRRSEPAALELGDMEFREEGLYVTFRKTKTDQEGKGLRKAVPYSSDALYCPVRATQAWVQCLHARGFTAGPVFRAIKGRDWVQQGALSPGAAVNRIKLYASKVGIEPGTVSGHSLRSGFATSAARKGRPERAIMKTTGHRKFDTVLKYIQDANLMKDSAAVGILDE